MFAIKKAYKSLFLKILCTTIFIYGCVQYCGAKNIEKVCAPRDSCSLRRPEYGWLYDSHLNGISMDEYYDSNCFCDHGCSLFDDCCSDSPLCLNSSGLVGKQISCRLPRGQQNPIYTYNSCPKFYPSFEIIMKCEKESDPIADPYTNLPVVSLNSNLTFKNIYCAVCNEQLLAVHSKSWSPKLRCKTLIPLPLIGPLVDFLLNSLLSRVIYNPLNGRWEPVFKGDPLVPEGCSMTFERPSGYEYLTRFCKNHIETCAPSWQDDHVRKLCSSYTAYVYKVQQGNVLDKIYRNVHCAKCNYENIDKLKCYYKPGNLLSDLVGAVQDTARNVISSVSPILNVSSLGLLSMERSSGHSDYLMEDYDYDDDDFKRYKRQVMPLNNPPTFPIYEFSYSMLLDTNFATGGNIVGTNQRCPQGQLHNPFTGSCEPVVCSRYLQFANGQCVSL